MLTDVSASAHDAVADVLEIAALPDLADYLVAFLQQVRRPFGCRILAIALDSQEKPAYYEKLLKRSGVEVLGIQLFWFETMAIGNFVACGCACMTIKRKDEKRAVRLLERNGAILAY